MLSYKREAAADFSIAKLSAKFSLAKRSGRRFSSKYHMHLIELDLEGLYINTKHWISRPKTNSMFKEHEHVEVIELAGSEARVQESMTSDAYGEVWLRTDKKILVVVKEPVREFRLQDLIDNELYYMGTVCLACIVSFAVGMLAGMLWTVFL